MSDPKGPKVELPEELVEELEEAALPPSEADGEDSDAQGEDDAAPVEAGGEPAGDASAPSDELEELRDRHLRLAADYENFKRRALKERQDLFNSATENLIKELLPAVDNLERALEHARQGEQATENKAVVEGVELTHRSLLKALEKFGVTVVEAEGREFDPQVHEAVRQVPAPDQPPGRVVEVLQKGYLLKDRLLRPALVAVSRRDAGASE